MMQQFTGAQYLMIDAANNFGNGLDKATFEERLQWAKDNLHQLESFVDQVKAKKRPLYKKSCMNIRRAIRGEAIGAMIGFDASCSGIQVMSALTGCVIGATNTGLVNPTKPGDAYSTCTEYMNQDLSGFSIDRDDAKQGLMTMMYGSSEEPKKIFGEDTPELSAFYAAAEKTAPGAYQLLQELLGAWQPYALTHEWELPDGFQVRVRVKTKDEIRITVDELDKASFTYQYTEYEGTKNGISLPANVTHSCDAYALRSIHRRCNYDYDITLAAHDMIVSTLYAREYGNYQQREGEDSKMLKYMGLYERTGMADVVILPYLDFGNVDMLSTRHLEALLKVIGQMLQHKPFPIVTIHDEFKCHPNNMNHLRKHYIEVFAEIAESTMLQDILNQITGNPEGVYEKHSTNLGDLIRQSNYAIS